MRKLPPLRALQVFEAAARHLNFSHAAAELCVTQSAVSHQIKQLENYFGETLFQRQGRQYQLTEKGDILFEELESLFNQLNDLSMKITGEQNQKLRLAVFSSFAIKWLIPRLGDFKKQHPQYNIRLNMITDEPTLTDTIADMFICGRDDQPGFWQTTLHHERLIAVCSPEFIDKTVEVSLPWFTRQPLLVVDEPGLGLDWDFWAQQNQLTLPTSQQRHIFSHVLLAIEAATAGQGVALASDFMVDSDIKAGKLIALNLPDVFTHFKFNFLCKQRSKTHPAIHAFIVWLQQQVADEKKANT
ncbi:LysR substrate-binding domain-containing protein [Shewanella intestini]|uniref:LysR family transcriptional regulator n=1 Tax=Shewanella intestini TaxID=2017544 RepID=A0ABS5I279_9GAMM|nr:MULTISPECIES: LysR substrate-binding domain-containing protein [Shewanella]MBR9728131.1 LysR family transcriptional regulator [Shewanella intestini]MRG36602.1 LysR family transcriptional regulator [Shewanella sp. XMDDZSB0408]